VFGGLTLMDIPLLLNYLKTRRLETFQEGQKVKNCAEGSVLQPGRQMIPSPHGTGLSSLLDGYHSTDQERLFNGRIGSHPGITLKDEQTTFASPVAVNQDVALSVAERPDLAPPREFRGNNPSERPG
jgi:hypothetical protein